MDYSMVEKTARHIPCLDVAKLIASIFVVAIHTYPLKSIIGEADIFRYLLCTWAVPFFFAASGYFILREYGMPEEGERIVKQFKRIAKMYVIWTLIYSPIILVRKVFIFENIFRGGVFVIRDFFLMGSYFQLWYLCAILWCLIFLFILNGSVRFKWFLMFSFVLYVFNYIFTYAGCILFTEKAYEIFSRFWEIIGDSNNGLFMGLFFTLVGKLVYETKIKIGDRFKEQHSFKIIFAVCIVLWLAEGAILYKSFYVIKQPMLTLGALVFLLLLFTVESGFTLPEEKSKHIRNLSTLIFLTHTFNITLLNELIGLLHLGYDGALLGSTLLFFAAVVMFSWIEAEIILMLSQKYRWLGNLY